MSSRVILVQDVSGVETKIDAANPLPVDVQGATLDADLSTVNANTSRLVSGTTPIDPATATATTALNIGGQYDSTQKTLTDGQQASYAMSARGAMIVTAGAEVLNVIQKGMGYSASVDVTRSADTTAYDAGDVVGKAGAAEEFANIGFAGEFLVTAVSLRFDIAAVPAGMTSFVLHLYSATPPSAPVDNAPFALSAGDAAVYLGLVSIPTPVDYGGLLYIEASGLTKQITLASSSLYAVLQTTAGWTPASEAAHTITVHTRAV